MSNNITVYNKPSFYNYGGPDTIIIISRVISQHSKKGFVKCNNNDDLEMCVNNKVSILKNAAIAKAAKEQV